MKLSIFTTASNFLERQDPYREALSSYVDLADEVVVMWGCKPLDEDTYNGKVVHLHHEWPWDFNWTFIGQQFNRAWQACTGDWVIHADLDFIFHENTMDQLRCFIEKNKNELSITFHKLQFLLVDRCRQKSKMVLAVNREKYGGEIKFDSGGDLCQPSYMGKTIEKSLKSNISFYNYDYCFKTKDVASRELHRMAKACNMFWPDKNWGYESEEAALKVFMGQQLGRLSHPHIHLPIDKHPKYMRKIIENITPEQFGYNMWGSTKKIAYRGGNDKIA